VPEWNFETSPVAFNILNDRNFASFAIGPVGSGKTVPLLMRIAQIGAAQAPSPDGVRRSRFAIIRNTMPELRSTTAVTFQQVYPAHKTGDIIWRSPPTHYFKPRGGKLEIETNFIALDRPADVKKLLSLELTGAALNEIREIPRSVVSRVTERVGRFGINERVSTWSGMWGDTNAPDADHWLYEWDKVNRPDGYEFYHQPPGVLEVTPIRGGAVINDENFPEHEGVKISSAEVLIYFKGRVQWVDCPIEVIAAADRHWIVSPWAENMVALSRVSAEENPLGANSYYGRALAGKTLAEIQSYLQGVYVYVQDGRRCVPQYHDATQAISGMAILQDEEVVVGMDIGGGTLQPSAIFFQRHPRGNHLAQGEVVCYDMGVKRFGELVSSYLVKHFPKQVTEGKIGTFWGDPAGVSRDEIFETASFDYLRAEHGFDCRPAPSQDPKMRIAALAGPCERIIDGKPGLLVSAERCPKFRKGLAGAWHYKRYQVSGEVAFSDKPVKNDYSHPCDGGGYGLLGMGEFERIGGRRKSDKAVVVTAGGGDFNVFD